MLMYSDDSLYVVFLTVHSSSYSYPFFSNFLNYSGQVGDTHSNELHGYDLSFGTWNTNIPAAGPRPSPRAFHSAVFTAEVSRCFSLVTRKV